MSETRALTLRVELRDADVETRRRLRLRDSLTLEHVHLALRAALGWEEGGEYEFEALGQTYRGSDAGDRELASRDARHPSRFTLSDFGPRPGETWEYRFDDDEPRSLRLTVEEMDRRGPDESPGPPAACLEASGPHPAGGGEDAGPASAEAVTRDLEAWLGSTLPGRAAGGAPRLEGEAARRAEVEEARPGATVEVELEPEAREALEEVFRRLDAETEGGADLPPPLRSATEELLIIQAEFGPGPLVGARKPETWAAGAVHAAHMELRRGRGSPAWTVEALAERFGVAPASVSRRSTEIRELAARHHFVPGPFGESFGDILAGAINGGHIRVRDAEGTGSARGVEAAGSDDASAPDPRDDIERLYRIGEETGRRSPYGRAAELLEEHADELDREDLKYLLQRGLDSADGRARRRMLDLAVRRFGTEVGTWAPEGVNRWL